MVKKKKKPTDPCWYTDYGDELNSVACNCPACDPTTPTVIGLKKLGKLIPEAALARDKLQDQLDDARDRYIFLKRRLSDIINRIKRNGEVDQLLLDILGLDDEHPDMIEPDEDEYGEHAEGDDD